MGRVLESSNGDARLMIYVEENEAHHSPASFVASNLTMPASRIDYRRITDRFFAVSGENNGRIFYSRYWTNALHFLVLQEQRKGSMGRHRYADQPVSSSTVKRFVAQSGGMVARPADRRGFALLARRGGDRTRGKRRRLHAPHHLPEDPFVCNVGRGRLPD